jgi:hypothetical protein
MSRRWRGRVRILVVDDGVFPFEQRAACRALSRVRVDLGLAFGAVKGKSVTASGASRRLAGQRPAAVGAAFAAAGRAFDLFGLHLYTAVGTRYHLDVIFIVKRLTTMRAARVLDADLTLTGRANQRPGRTTL